MKPAIFEKQPTEKQLVMADYILQKCNVDEKDLPNIESRSSVSIFISKYITEARVIFNEEYDARYYDLMLRLNVTGFFNNTDNGTLDYCDYDYNCND